MGQLKARERASKIGKAIVIGILLLSGIAVIGAVEHHKQIQHEQQIQHVQQVERQQAQLIAQKQRMIEQQTNVINQKQQELNKAKAQVSQLQKQVTKLSGRSESSPLNMGPEMTMIATWYDSQGGINGTGITATDTVPTDNRTIAVDPHVIPLHSKVYVIFPDGHTHIYTAEDTGGAIIGNRIDIYDSNPTACFDNGRQVVKVFVLPSH